jgi:endonuclease/exonuclease/phosphatase family metal-dependent hydrolase
MKSLGSGFVPISAVVFLVSSVGCGPQRAEPDAAQADLWEPKPDTGIVRVASFNIQDFGPEKMAEEGVADALVEIFHQFDIVAVQEVSDRTEEVLGTLEARLDQEGNWWSHVASPRLGTTNQKEQYAFFYDTRLVSLVEEGQVYPDPAYETFERPPFAARFRAGEFDFVLVTVHTRPGAAAKEINALADVGAWAWDEAFPEEEDIIILGDFNADCTYFNPKTELTSLHVDTWRWVIGDDADTTVKSTNCAYDRLVFLAVPTEDDYAGAAGVLRFDDVLDLGGTAPAAVSDHYPVWAEFRTDRDAP